MPLRQMFPIAYYTKLIVSKYQKLIIIMEELRLVDENSCPGYYGY